ncbi:MAG: hypothetical protein J7578_07410 [Chitinophagaceae bacterium]|nr:hypothetical protein [Chitinophagaceae bacterium]
MRIRSPFNPEPFTFQTSFRPEDIEFIVMEQLWEPGFLGPSRPYGEYYGEADDTCFIIRGVYANNRPRRPVAHARMEKNDTGGSLVTVAFKAHWVTQVLLGTLSLLIPYSLYHLFSQPFTSNTLTASLGAFLFYILFFLLFRYFFRSDCKKMKAMILDIFKGQEIVA